MLVTGDPEVAHRAAVLVNVGRKTGIEVEAALRAANDKFIVDCGEPAKVIDWGKVNKPLSCEHYERLYLRMIAYFQGRDIFIQDSYACAHPQYRLPGELQRRAL